LQGQKIRWAFLFSVLWFLIGKNIFNFEKLFPENQPIAYTFLKAKCFSV